MAPSQSCLSWPVRSTHAMRSCHAAGGSSELLVMLSGDGSVFVARGGRLYDANDEEVRGVESEVRGAALILSAGSRRYAIELPK